MIRSLFMLTLLINSCGSGNNNAKVKPDTLSYVKNEQPKTSLTSNKEMVDSNFLSFWKQFTDIVKNKNQRAFMAMSLDSLLCEQKVIGIQTFINAYYSKVFDDTVLIKITDRSKVDFMNYTMEAPSLSPLIARRIKPGIKIIKQVSITKVDKYPEGPVTIVLEFIETRKGYKFYGYDKFG